MLAVKVDDVPLVLCHYGMRVWEGSQRGVIHLYGQSPTAVCPEIC